MNNEKCKLTVFFENPFWVGIIERIDNGKLSVSKVVFYSEPKDCEVYEFVLKDYIDLKFSKSILFDLDEKKINPKRLQREVKKSVQCVGVGTKSQQILKHQYEQLKKERKKEKINQKELEKIHKFELKQQKKKEKHKGR